MLLVVAAIAASAFLSPLINRQRRDLQLSFDMKADTQLPVKYALLPAMGSLRGIAVDALWYRAEMLKRQGKFFEANTLARLITDLQPRFPAVWVFHAWNLAFNISVETYTPQERWDWVNKGIRLLRDEGLVYNPRSVLIYKELAWCLFFKVGKSTDDAHWYYKTMWAQEWNDLLGAPPLGKVDDEKNQYGRPVYQATAGFKHIADAADKYFAAQRTIDPVTRFEQDHPEIAPLMTALRQAGLELNARDLRRLGQFLALEPYISDMNVLKNPPPGAPAMPPLDAAALNIVTDSKLRPMLDTLLPFWRAKALIEDYHMQPQKMYELMDLFGPMDWRHPASHAAYFGYLGAQMAGELRDDSKIDVLNTDRGVIHAMQLLTTDGMVEYNPISGRLDLLPDPRFIPAYDEAWDIARNRQIESAHGVDVDAGDAFANGHENFLLRAMLYAYLYGDIDQARHYFTKARNLYADTPANQYTKRYRDTLEDMVITELSHDWDLQEVAVAFIQGMVQQAMLRGLLNNRADVFDRYTNLGRLAYDRYQEKRGYSNLLTERGRLSLPDTWRDTFNQSYAVVMSSPMLSIPDRATIWHNTPITIQLDTYLLIRPDLRTQCDQQQIDFNRAFPAPPGFVEPTTPQLQQQNVLPDVERQ